MPRPLRALHVYAGNLYGGVERMLATFAATRVDGLEHAFALCFPGRAADELAAAGARVELIGPVRMRRPWTALRARRRLGAAIDAIRPDVVVCHATWSHGIFAPVVRRRDVPLVFWLHDAVTGATWADRLARRTRPDAAVATSRFAAGTLPRLWGDVSADVVYPPVPHGDAGRIDPSSVRRGLHTPGGDAVLLQASRMEPWKGHRLLLDALGTMRDVAGWTCWIAGGARRPHERRHEAEMRARAAALGIGARVRFLGERDDVPALMRAADVLCQPNLGPEPFGIAFVEAMHAGLPVVATALGGAREVVDRATGVLVPPDDAGALSHALRALVADPARRARLGAAGPARAEALSDPARQAARLRDLLTRIARPATR